MTIQDIRDRLAAATPGPWIMNVQDEWSGNVRRLEAPNGQDSSALMCDMPYYPWTFDREEDWEFVAHAPEDIQYLLDELEKAHKNLDVLIP